MAGPAVRAVPGGRKIDLSNAKFETDLTQGHVGRQLVLFALPFLVSNIVQSLYNVADMLIVGNFAGTISMSGVNIGGQITHILTQLVMGLCTGGTILIAQYMGSKRREEARQAIATLMTTLVLAALFITCVMFFLQKPILGWVNTPAESMDEAYRYVFICNLGILFIFAYNALAAVMRGLGDSKRPFYFVLIACVTNVALDLILVGGFGMGASGAAIATVFSQALSVVLCVVYLARNDFIFDFKLSSFRLHMDKLRLIFRFGLPTCIKSGVASFSFLFITALVNTVGGVDASAAVGVVSKFNSFAIMPAIAIDNSISTMSAQNVGAGQWDRAARTCRVGMTISFAISVCIFALAQLFPAQILALFDRNPAMIAAGVTYMRTFSLDYLLVPFVFSFSGLFKGSSHTTFSLIDGLLSSLVLRVPACYLFGLALNMGLTGIGLGAPLATLGSLLLDLWFFLSGRWRVNLIEKRQAAIQARLAAEPACMTSPLPAALEEPVE